MARVVHDIPTALYRHPILAPYGAIMTPKRTWRTAWLAFGLFAASFAPAPVRAEGVPIVVERYDAAIGPRDAAAVLRGDFDEHLCAEAAATVTPSHRSTTWYRVRLADDWLSPHEPALVISEASDIVVHAYAPPDYADAEYSVYRSDGGRGRARHVLIVPLMNGWRAATPVYLRIDSATAAEHELSVTDMATAQETELAQARFDIVWPITQIAVLLAALAVLRPWRQRVHLLFFGQTLGIAIATLYKSGVGFEYWPLDLLAPLGIKANALTVAATTAMALLFVREFVDLPRRAPALARANVVVAGFLLLFAIACVLPLPWADWLLMSTLATMMLFAMTLTWSSGIVGWLRGQRNAVFYVAGWTPASFAMILRTLSLLAQTPSPTWLTSIMPALFTLFTLVLLHGLALRSCASSGIVAIDTRERDALTGALSRSATFAHLREAFVDARSRHRPLSILSIETSAALRERAQPHGRGVVDACLQTVMACLDEELRGEDIVGRHGDDRLLVILPGIDLAGAQSIAQRVARRVAERTVHIGGECVGVATDVGVAGLEDDMVAPDALIARADAERCGMRRPDASFAGAA